MNKCLYFPGTTVFLRIVSAEAIDGNKVFRLSFKFWCPELTEFSNEIIDYGSQCIKSKQ